MGRSPCCDKAAVKRGPWSAEEDARLRSYIVEHHGTGGGWMALPRKAGLRRCGKSCRLRWLNYLRPGVRHGGFSPEEDRVICALYAAVGSRWSLIAAQLPGRTDNGVKNYWNTRLKKKLLAAGGIGNKLQLQPQPHGGECYNNHAASSEYEYDNINGASAVSPLPPYWTTGGQGQGSTSSCNMDLIGGGSCTHKARTSAAATCSWDSDSTTVLVETKTTELDDEILRCSAIAGEGDHYSAGLSHGGSTDVLQNYWGHWQW